jgi:hypothetical protein
LALLAKRDSTNGAKSLSMNSRKVGTGAFSRIPTPAFASETLWAASICSATRLFGCFVLFRIWRPRQVNLYHQFFEPFCL